MAEAIVALGDSKRIVGRLRFEAKGRRQFSAFSYDPKWLEDPRAFALSPALPLQEGAFYASAKEDSRDALSGCFSDAAPDSWGRALMTKALGGGLTEFDYLIRADDRTRQGALRFLDDELNPLSGLEPPVPRRVDLADLRETAARFERDPASAGEAAQLLAGVAGSLGGARPKANVMDGDDLWIAKFTSVLDTRPVERVEVATLSLAKMAGIRASEAQLELRESDYPVALIKRFDRRAGGRVPYMSARTAMQVTGSEQGFYSDLADVIRQISYDARQDLEELWKRIVFTILVSNTDDHLKNHGFIYVRDGLWRLAPAFDINPQPERHRHMETGISPISGFDPSIEAAVEQAPLFDLGQDAAQAMAAEMAMTLRSHWRASLRQQGLSSEALKAYAPAFEHDEANNALSWRT